MTSDDSKRTTRKNPIIVDDLTNLLATYKTEDIFKTCVTCCHLVKDDICKRANVRPPAFVIVRGCEHYFDNDDIPF
jgi:hypothetical protein